MDMLCTCWVLSTSVQVDARVGLFLNNGSQSNPTVVVLLSPEMLEEQLNRACQAFVDHTVKVMPMEPFVLPPLCCACVYRPDLSQIEAS